MVVINYYVFLNSSGFRHLSKDIKKCANGDHRISYIDVRLFKFVEIQILYDIDRWLESQDGNKNLPLFQCQYRDHYFNQLVYIQRRTILYAYLNQLVYIQRRTTLYAYLTNKCTYRGELTLSFFNQIVYIQRRTILYAHICT